jgi:hypothetical protein
MSPEKLAKFTSKVTEGIYCGPNDERIQNVFKEYAENTNYLTLEEFLNFYRDCALKSDFKL